MFHLHHHDIRPIGPEDAAALFVVQAAIEPVDAGGMLEWVGELEERLESGGLAWVVVRGRKLAGYAAIDPVPGLPGVYDLSGGIVPAWRGQGLGTRLLRHVQDAAGPAGARYLSCRVDSLGVGTARFLLGRDFYVEHEECLLELADLASLPPVPELPAAELLTMPAERAATEFCRVYNESFAGRPWSQPYSEAEVAALLVNPEDLLFAVVDGRAVGVVWHEVLTDGRGRVEPLGIVPQHQGQGLGRRLLLAALHDLQRHGAGVLEIGVWRDNRVALNLYRSLGFQERDNWYFVACDVVGRTED